MIYAAFTAGLLSGITIHSRFPRRDPTAIHLPAAHPFAPPHAAPHSPHQARHFACQTLSHPHRSRLDRLCSHGQRRRNNSDRLALDQRREPKPFRFHLGSASLCFSLRQVTDVNASDALTARHPERFIVLCLLLLKSTMGDWAAQSPVVDDVPPDFVRQFVQILVTKLLPLRAIDLEKWAEDPEEWMNEEEADRWEFELRVSAQPRQLWLVA